jgi:taurine dioxygenase
MFIAFSLTLLCLASFLFHINEAFTVNTVRPDNPFGCEVLNADIRSLSKEDFDELHRTLLQCRVVVVRNQPLLSVEDQRQFSQRFGTLHVHLESASHHDGYADVNLVSNIKHPETGQYIGLYGKHVESFHSDLSW